MSQTLCQRCNSEHNESWNVHQAEFHVGRIVHWKVQLCPKCMTDVEQAVLAVLKSTYVFVTAAGGAGGSYTASQDTIGGPGGPYPGNQECAAKKK